MPSTRGGWTSYHYFVQYVDDITILGASLEAVKHLKANLAKRYEMSDLGEIESYLGVHITRCTCRISLYTRESFVWPG